MIRIEKKQTVIRSTKTGINILVLVVIATILSTCHKDKRKSDALKIINQLTGKEIMFPHNLSCTSMGKDTTCINLYNDNYKILLYVDSLGCTNCKLQQLAEWKKIMQESDTLFSKKLEFVFFLQSNKIDEIELQFSLVEIGFSHPVFIDQRNEIGKLNEFPSNPDYQCYLLDKNNRVLLIGNPALVSRIWQLYKRVIHESELNEINTNLKLKNYVHKEDCWLYSHSWNCSYSCMECEYSFKS